MLTRLLCTLNIHDYVTIEEVYDTDSYEIFHTYVCLRCRKIINEKEQAEKRLAEYLKRKEEAQRIYDAKSSS